MLLGKAAWVRREVRAGHRLQVKSRPVLLVVRAFYYACVLVVLVACVVVPGTADVAAGEHDHLSILQMPAVRPQGGSRRHHWALGLVLARRWLRFLNSLRLQILLVGHVDQLVEAGDTLLGRLVQACIAMLSREEGPLRCWGIGTFVVRLLLEVTGLPHLLLLARRVRAVVETSWQAHRRTFTWSLWFHGPRGGRLPGRPSDLR